MFQAGYVNAVLGTLADLGVLLETLPRGWTRKERKICDFVVRNFVESTFWLYIIFPSSSLYVWASSVTQKARWIEFIIAMKVKQNIHDFRPEHRWLEKRISVLHEMLIL